MSFADKYELVRQLGSGGMGEVFLARVRGVPGFEKQVVVKRLHAHLGTKPEIASLFLQEARLVAQMSHPNIVQVFDAGQSEETLWLVMEFVNGPNLLQVIRRAREQQRSVPLGIACRIISDVCAGLAYAHSLTGRDGQPLGLIHRDLSPDNILVDQTGQAKVTDFGIAKVRDSEVQTQPGWTRGKYRYMAPEQLLGLGSLNQQADLFVVGVVFAELLTLRHPFCDETGALAPARVCASDYPPLSTLRADLPRELELLIRRALASKPEDRFPSCKAMRAAIEQFLRGVDHTAPEDVAEFLHALTNERPFTPSSQAVLRETAETVRDLGRVNDTTTPGQAPPPEPVRTSDLVVELDAAPARARGRARFAWAGLVVAVLTFGITAIVLAQRGANPRGATSEADAGQLGAPPFVLVEPPADAGPVIVEGPGDAGEGPPGEDATLAGARDATVDAGASVPTKPAKSAPRFGQVELRVRPPATVSVDGVVMGETPLPVLKLSVGPHRFRFVNDEVDQVRTFDVKPGSQRIGVTLP